MDDFHSADQLPLFLMLVDQAGQIVLAEGKPPLTRVPAEGKPPLTPGTAEGKVPSKPDGVAAKWIGHRLSEVRADRPALVEGLERALGGDASHLIERQNGGGVEVRFYPRHDQAGAVSGAVAVGFELPPSDAPPLVRSESRQRTHSIFEQIPGGVWATDCQPERSPM